MHAFATNIKTDLWDIEDAEDFETKFPRLLKLSGAVDCSYLGRGWRREQERKLKKDAAGELSDDEIRGSDAYRRLSALKKPRSLEIVQYRTEEVPSELLTSTLHRL